MFLSGDIVDKGGTGGSNANSDFFANLLTDAAGAVSLYNQEQIFNLNKDRLKQNMSPVYVPDTVTGVVPTIGVQASLNQSTQGTALLGLALIAGVAIFAIASGRRSKK